MSDPNFSKSQFLKQGGLFGKGDQFYLFWGTLNKSKTRPLHPALLVCDYFLNREWDWWCFENHLVVDREQLTSLFASKPQAWSWQDPDRAVFDKQFSQIVRWFADDWVTKVVPYVFETAPGPINPKLLESLLGSLVNQEQGYVYGAWTDGDGILGLTPELLLEEQGNSMKTMALAGTRSLESFTEDPHEFLNDKKELREHQIVVEDLIDKLSAYTDVQVSKTTIEKTPTLAHMKTDVTFRHSEGGDLMESVKKLHPTPALGCSPYIRTEEVMGLLDDWLPRGRFGAPFGISYHEQAATIVVAIRNLLWDSKEVRVGSGCGVVEQSEIDREWIELKNKRNSVKKVFGLS